MDTIKTSVMFISEKYKLVVFDFDLTITNVHLGSSSFEQISNRNMFLDFPDINMFRILIHALNLHGVKTAIMSLNSYDVIKLYMDYAFGSDNAIFNASNIITPRNIGEQERVNSDEKNKMLEFITMKYKLQYKDILYFDDSEEILRKTPVDQVLIKNRRGLDINILSNLSNIIFKPRFRLQTKIDLNSILHNFSRMTNTHKWSVENAYSINQENIVPELVYTDEMSVSSAVNTLEKIGWKFPFAIVYSSSKHKYYVLVDTQFSDYYLKNTILSLFEIKNRLQKDCIDLMVKFNTWSWKDYEKLTKLFYSLGGSETMRKDIIKIHTCLSKIYL